MKRKDLLIGIVLGLIGFTGNWLNLELFFDVNFLFGSFFVMFAITRFGAIAGIISGILAGTCTYFLWHHPWAIIIFSGEALFVSWRVRGRNNNLITSDIFYWLLMGAPLVWLFYHQFMSIQPQSTILIMLKQSLNGVFNSLLATLAVLILQLTSRKNKEPVPFRQLIFASMVSLVLIPSLIAIVLNLKKEMKYGSERLIDNTLAISEQAQIILTQWLQEHGQPVKSLANIVGNPEKTTPETMQRQLEIIKASSPSILRMGVFDRNAFTRAYYPRTDDSGRSTIGVDFSDRPYIPIIKQGLNPYVSDLLLSKFLKTTSFVAILFPIVDENEYQGFCSGVVDTKLLSKILAAFTEKKNSDLTILDRNGRVIVSTRNNIKINDLFQHSSIGMKVPLKSGVSHCIPPPEKGTSIMQRWRKSTYEKQVKFAPYIGWTLVSETSLMPLLQELTRDTVFSLSALLLIIVMIVGLSELISRYLVCGVDLLQNFTSMSPEYFLEANYDLKWPSSRIREFSALIENFRRMSVSLRDYLRELKTVNSELVQRIEERKRIEKELRENQKRLEEITMDLTLAEVNERYRIAGELHDQVGQRMILSKIKLDSLMNKLPDAEYEDDLDEIIRLIDQTLQEIRSMTFQLRPPLLANAGLEAALQWLAAEMDEDYGLKIDIEDDLQPKPLRYEVSSLIFQIVRELLINIAKHAGTKSAMITIIKEGDSIVLIIEDKGKGFNTSEIDSKEIKSGGFGIFNIKQKIEYLGGKFKLESYPGKGTKVTITSPLENSKGASHEFENTDSR
jgi:signal transduction histidine kinase